MVVTTATKRPRNVNVFQAAAILYGDWGTSKAYVIGLAFALAGYSAFWQILAVCILMLLVGWNYISICKFNPSGGGVYNDARKHSEVLALVAAFFLIADYLITAAISSLACFTYLGVAHPAYWAIGSIIVIGIINFFGPRHSGNLALVVALLTVFIVVTLGVLALPFVGNAVHHIQPPEPGILKNWDDFVGIIVALSGIEAIANATGVMRLDPGSTEDRPSVHQISKRAILWVMMEVCFFTAFFGLMVNAIPGLRVVDDQVFSSDNQEVRDSMLRYMGQYFVSHFWGGQAEGYLFGTLVSLVFGVLLLSAVNTAMVALISLLFVMSRDGEMPEAFQSLTPFGVPRYPLLIAIVAVVTILFFVHDVAALANLYAVGFVGAIATHLAVVAADQTLPLTKKERYVMWFTCLILIAIEVTLFITKPGARRFVISFVAVGLLSRMWVVERRQKQWAAKKVKLRHASLFTDDTRVPLHEGAILCAVRTIGKTLNFALQEAKRYNQPLYILFIREQKVVLPEDRARTWLDDEEACKIFDYAKDSASEIDMKFFYEVSDSPVETIANMAQQLHVSRVILGRPRHSVMLQLLRGNIVQEISEVLPPEIDLLVIS
jgi:amino acid transporter/nucleotide-binding universal stress UspA family protein